LSVIADSGHFAPDRGGHIPTTSDADDDPTDVLLLRASGTAKALRVTGEGGPDASLSVDMRRLAPLQPQSWLGVSGGVRKPLAGRGGLAFPFPTTDLGVRLTQPPDLPLRASAVGRTR
jgi:hypothetical protein